MLLKINYSLMLLIASYWCFSQKLTINAGPYRTVCANTTYTLGGSPTVSGGNGPYSYNWYPSNFLNSTTIANPIVTGINTDMWYKVVVIDKDSTIDSAYVFFKYDIIKTFNAGIDTGYCLNQQPGVVIGASNNNNTDHIFLWYPTSGLNNATATNPIATPSVNTTYTLTVSDGKCPDYKTTVTVNAYIQPTINAGLDTTINEGETITIKAIGATKFWWQPDYNIKYGNTATPDVWPTTTTTYVLYTTDKNGCWAGDDVLVTVKSGNTLYFYNTFTPNGDKDNDVFYIGNIEKFPDNNLKIYNRYGKSVFSATNYINDWDGKYLGSDIPAGTYYYILNDGIDKTYKGTVTLLR